MPAKSWFPVAPSLFYIKTTPLTVARQEQSLVTIRNRSVVSAIHNKFPCVAICMRRPVSNIEGQMTKDSMTKPVPAILVSVSGASATILMTCELR